MSHDPPPAARPDDERYVLFYDRLCPFCRLEVDWLLRRRHAHLAVVDIADPSFDPAAWGVDAADVHRELHGRTPEGRITVGMESVRRSYAAAGVGWLMAWTAWPVLRRLADLGYAIFARYRVPLGRLLGRSCEDGACAVPRSGGETR